MRITGTSTPARGIVYYWDNDTRTLVDATRTITVDDAVIFASTDTRGKTSIYRLAHITVYSDGSLYVWAAQLTKALKPRKDGLGLTLDSSLERIAKFYGAGVAAEVAEAIKITEPIM